MTNKLPKINQGSQDPVKSALTNQVFDEETEQIKRLQNQVDALNQRCDTLENTVDTQRALIDEIVDKAIQEALDNRDTLNNSEY